MGGDDKELNISLDKILEGHSNSVWSVAWSPDGACLASGSEDNTVRIWNPVSGESLKRLEGHSAWVNSVAWSPDGACLASGSWDQTVRIWNPVSGESLKRLEGHSGYVLSVAWSPDGACLAAGSDDKTVRIWNPVSGESLKRLEGHSHCVRSVAWSPDGACLASGSGDTTVRIWNPVSGESLKRLEGHSHYVHSVAWSPDGACLASGSDDKTVRIWNPVSGESLKRLEGHSGYVRSVAWSPDGACLASGSHDKTVRIWNPVSGESLKRLEGHSDYVWSVAWSPDGARLASGSEDKTVRIWSGFPGLDALEVDPPPVTTADLARNATDPARLEKDSAALASEIYYGIKERLGPDSVWLDVKMKTRDEAAMKEGIDHSDVFLVIASENYFKSFYCCMEVTHAMESNKQVMVTIDVKDKQRIGEFMGDAPANLKGMGSINFIDLNRGDVTYMNTGIDLILSAKTKCIPRAAAMGAAPGENALDEITAMLRDAGIKPGDDNVYAKKMVEDGCSSVADVAQFGDAEQLKEWGLKKIEAKKVINHMRSL